VGDYLQGSIPYLRNSMTPKRTVLGDTISQEPSGIGAFVNLFNSKTPDTSSVVQELGRLTEIGNSATPSKLTANIQAFGKKMKLSPDDLDQLEKDSGGQIKQRFTSTINSDGYKLLSDDQKSKVLSGIVDEVRTNAKKKIITDGGIQSSGNGLINNLLSATDKARAEAGKGTTNPSTSKPPTKEELDTAKYLVESGQKESIKVGNTYVSLDENGNVRTKTEAQLKKSTKAAQQTLDLQTYKADDNYKAWEGVQKERYNELKYATSKLDPVLDADTIVKNQNTLDDILTQVRKYRGYGNAFNKPKKGRKAKAIPRVSVSTSKASMPTIKRIRLK
jgi:hypothetical protein